MEHIIARMRLPTNKKSHVSYIFDCHNQVKNRLMLQVVLYVFVW